MTPEELREFVCPVCPVLQLPNADCIVSQLQIHRNQTEAQDLEIKAQSEEISRQEIAWRIEIDQLMVMGYKQTLSLLYHKRYIAILQEKLRESGVDVPAFESAPAPSVVAEDSDDAAL